MNFEQAKEIGRKHRDCESIIVLSDGSVYLNADKDEVKKHADESKLEFFQIKPEEAPKKKK